MRRSALLFLIALVAPATPARAADGVVHRGTTVAHLSVTVHPDAGGTIPVPSPFAVVPGTGEVVIRVPESDGTFVLRGEEIRHHFPDSPALRVFEEMETNGEIVVAGHAPAEGRTTAELTVFDLSRRALVERIFSANPFLRRDPDSADLWRVVVDGPLVGVYQPVTGASYPLWEAGAPVPSSEQVERMKAGIGFGGETRVVPAADGSVALWQRGRTVPLSGPDDGEFLDAAGPDGVLLLQPAETVRADADGQFLLPRELAVRLVRTDGTRTDARLRSLGRDVRAKRLVLEGRPVRVVGDTVYWIYLGADYLEIRSVPLGELGAAGS